METTEQHRRISQARRDFAAGRLSAKEYDRLIRSLGVEDALALLLEGYELRRQGRLAEAEDAFWRSADLAPYQPQAFIALSELRLLHPPPEDMASRTALKALCLLKTAYQPEMWKDPGLSPVPEDLFRDLPLPEAAKKSPSPADRAEMAGELLLQLVLESEDVRDSRLWRHVLLTTVFNRPMMDENVEWLLDHSDETMPLLAAIVDGYREGMLGICAEIALENALALLGEGGGPRYLENVLTVFPRLEQDHTQAAEWALSRWMAHEPGAFAAELYRLQPRLGADDLGWLVIALGRAARGAGMAPVWEALFEIGCGVGDSRGTWSAGLAVAAHLVFGPRDKGNRAARAEKRFAKNWNAETRIHVHELLKVDGAEIDSYWAASEERMPSVHEICTGCADWHEDAEEDGNGEEIPGSALEAEVRLRATGRNDPCWCGSGRKYRKCHLEEDEALARGEQVRKEAAPSPDPYRDVRRDLPSFTLAGLSPSQLQECIHDFFGPEGEVSEDHMQGFVDWLVHDCRPAGGGPTFLERFLRAEGARLDPAVRESLGAWVSAAMDLYEVRNIEEGKGLRLRSCETGEEIFVHDVSLSRRLTRGDSLFCRILREGELNVASAYCLAVARDLAADLQEWMREDRRRTGLGRAAHLKARWPALRRFALELAERGRRHLRLNADGEPIELHRVVFEVLNGQAVSEALACCPSLTDDGGGCFTWLRTVPGSANSTILGSLRLSEERLVLECDSRNRAAAGRQLLEKIAGAHVRYIADETRLSMD
ncbi:MAG: hypothetical protein KatS3mg005_2695 [Bryobacteraceae bacterium]|nr:MAG: hypothetical protein KatS3mg005_2695 [Bryobacteraceae bacterium]